MRVCFFAKVEHPSLLERIEFYRQDIEILRELGFHVIPATCWKEIPADVDLHFIWWWQWAFLPMLKSFRRKIPALVTGVFDYRWPSGRDYLHRPAWQKWLMRDGLKRAKANVFISEIEMRVVTEALQVTRPLYIPPVIHTDVFRPGAQDREDFVFTVALMKGLSPWRKCIPEIIQSIPGVVERHPEIRFIIAGERGGAHADLVALAAKLGVARHLDFLGVISHEKKIELMQRCKVYLQPTRYEGFGLAILEAMSCGAPVVSSPAGAVPEVVGDAGLLVNGESPEAIAAAIDRYLEDAPLRQRMGDAARRRAETVFPYSRRRNELGKAIADMLDTA
jgi:glycosyltransferase involved in cell wall biosynthesis